MSPRHCSPDLTLLLLLALFTVLAAAYSIAVPIFEGPDEDDHFRYAKFLADQRALPVQLFQSGGGAAGHQGWQPPLYYSLAALIIAPIDTSDFETHLWRNPAASYQGDRACCGRNLYFHTDQENFPYASTTLAVHLARGLTILFGLLTLASIYTLLLTIFPAQRMLALAATAVAAFNPSFLFASSLVSNDVPLAAFCSLTLFLCVRLLVGNRTPDVKDFLLVGIIIALGLLVKTTALGLIPLALGVAGFSAWRAGTRRPSIFWSAVGVVLVACAALAGWWFARNQILYGDPLAYRLVYTSAIFPREQPFTWAELFQINLPWLWQTFWGGPTPGDFAPALLLVLGLLTTMALAGTIIFFITRSRTLPIGQFAALGLLTVWLGFIFLAQIQFIRTSGGTDQGRYLFPALAPFAILFVIGLNELARQVGAWAKASFGLHASARSHLPTAPQPQSHTFFSLALVLCSITLALNVLFVNTLPAYAHPLPVSAQALAAAHAAEINFDNQIELRGFDLPMSVVQAGDVLEVNLFWRDRATMTKSYKNFVQLVNAAGIVFAHQDVIPARGTYATVLWRQGELVGDQVHLPIAPDTAPGRYSVQIGWYPYGEPDHRLTARDINGRVIDPVLLTAVKVAPRVPPTFNPSHLVAVNFENRARLRGYDITRTDARLGMTLYWNALAPFDADYAIFVHLTDARGQIIMQADHQPQQGHYPTSIWSPGETLADSFEMASASNGVRLELGLYRVDTAQRLAIFDAHNQPVGDSFSIDLNAQ